MNIEKIMKRIIRRVRSSLKKCEILDLYWDEGMIIITNENIYLELRDEGEYYLSVRNRRWSGDFIRDEWRIYKLIKRYDK